MLDIVTKHQQINFIVSKYSIAAIVNSWLDKYSTDYNIAKLEQESEKH
jgi:hypothetical protein